MYTGFQWTGYFAGEIRNVRRTATTSILGALAVSAIGYVAGVGLIYRYFGFKFFGASMFMGLGGGASHWNLKFLPYLPSLVNFLPGPQWLLVFVALCFVHLDPVVDADRLHARAPATCSPGPSTGSRRRS